jgi:hypothetical protein
MKKKVTRKKGETRTRDEKEHIKIERRDKKVERE